MNLFVDFLLFNALAHYIRFCNHLAALIARHLTHSRFHDFLSRIFASITDGVFACSLFTKRHSITLLAQGFTTLSLYPTLNIRQSTTTMPALSLSMMSTIKVAVFALAFSHHVSAHTWVEQMSVIGLNGSLIGDYGYPRGYVARTDAGFTGYSNKWQLPSPDTDAGRTRITDSMMVCHPSQRTATYSSQYPQLSVAPGSYVAMKYLENGHVTQPFIPAGKPKGSGTVFIFGTYEPSASETLVNVLSWTKDGKGGNGKGWLMAAQNYDDLVCRQLNQAPISINRQMSDGNHPPSQPTVQLERWCEADLLIPANAPIGATLTTYFVWDWNTGMQTEGAMCGKDEYYTTCSDFKVLDGGDDLTKLAAVPAVHTLVQQDPNTIAVSDYLSRTADNPTPTIITEQSCNYTSATSSPIPASLTEHTTLPAGYSTSISRPPMPKYRVGGSPAAGIAQPTQPQQPAQSAQATQSAQPTQPAQATQSAQSAIPTSEAASTSAVAPTTGAQGQADAAPTMTVTVSPSYKYSTITITKSDPALVTAVVNSDGIIGTIGKRDAHVRAHGRLRHNVRP